MEKPRSSFRPRGATGGGPTCAGDREDRACAAVPEPRVVAGWTKRRSMPVEKGLVRLLIALLVAATAGCGRSRVVELEGEIAHLRGGLAEATDAVTASTAQGVVLREQLASTTAQLAACQQTADGAWAEIARVQRDGGGDELPVHLDSFIARFVADPRVATAKKMAAALKLKKEEAEALARLARVTIEEIVTDPGRYRNKRFSRRLCCQNVVLSDYVSESAIAELNWRTSKQHNTTCFWRWSYQLLSVGWSGLPDRDTSIELRLDQKFAARIAREAPKPDYGGYCKYQFDAVIGFAGQISSGRPVMYLKDADFTVTPEPESPEPRVP